jgi:DNA polymerase III epsilon subunit-like protein
MYKVLSDETPDLTYAFIDMETCNAALHEIHDLPWQASVVIVKNKQIIRDYDFFIKWTPLPVVSKGAALKTRYDENKVISKGLPPEEVYNILLPEIEAADKVCGHNILFFDIYIWQAWARKIGKPVYNFAPKAVDTAAIAKGLKLGTSPNDEADFIPWQYRSLHTRKKGLKFSLESLGKEFDIEHDYENLHDALTDLQLNVKVFNRLKYGVVL